MAVSTVLPRRIAIFSDRPWIDDRNCQANGSSSCDWLNWSRAGRRGSRVREILATSTRPRSISSCQMLLKRFWSPDRPNKSARQFSAPRLQSCSVQVGSELCHMQLGTQESVQFCVSIGFRDADSCFRSGVAADRPWSIVLM